MRDLYRSLQPIWVLWLIALLVAGCASASVTGAQRARGKLPRPDRMLVYDFAVTPQDVALDRGAGPKFARGSGTAAQSQEEIRVGRAVSKVLSDNLVKELRKRGINAYLANKGAPPADTTVSIKGRFLRIDQGNRTKRTLVGFGFGGSQLRTQVLFYQGAGPKARLVGKAETITRSSLKPGIAPMLGLGAVAGTLGMAAGVSGTTTIASETLWATVEADAKRTAKAVAARVARYYRQQGWIRRK